MTKRIQLRWPGLRQGAKLSISGVGVVLFVFAGFLTSSVSALAGVAVQDLESVLRGQGYTVEMFPDVGIHGQLKMEREATEFSIYPAECEGPTDDMICKGYVFQQKHEGAAISSEQINEWNRRAFFGRAYFRGETPNVELSIFVGSIAPGQRFLAETLDLWHRTMESFPPDGDGDANGQASNESDDWIDELIRQKVFSSAIHCPDLSDEYYESANSLTFEGRDTISGQVLYDEGDSMRWRAQAGGDKVIEECLYLPEPSGSIDDDLLYTVDIDMDGDFDLEVRTTADCDTVLLVLGPVGPDGRWYFDDDGGGDDTQEKVRIPDAPGGEYAIWVGTLDGDYCDAKIELETF